MDEADRNDEAPASADEPGDERRSSDDAPPTDDRSSDPDLPAPGDEERDLTALPPAPRWPRLLTLAVMAATTLASILVAWSLRHEAAYALLDPQPLEVGDLRDARLSEQHTNRYVRAYVNLERSPAVEYGRTAERDRYRLVPVAGAPGVWVEHRVPSGYAGPRFLPPTRVAGRLVRPNDLGVRYRGVAAALEHAQQGRPPGGTWLLLDGIDPNSSRWCLALASLLAAFALWNVWGIARLTRRVPVS